MQSRVTSQEVKYVWFYWCSQLDLAILRLGFIEEPSSFVFK